ncbi:hypothetical protein QBC36DRAFT_293061 [Triangularia setosa]|uniref:Uncharacterized protein n=1 Tax=Triangularia setosa TaxID=2587417 RepID=A0AAN6W3X1_9PEZI|nr:hypothetical protein QBC36DRAFT_293061 [Podospora setosa]
MECEGAASSTFSCNDLCRSLGGESDWTVPIMPKWAQSPARTSSDDINRRIETMSSTIHDQYRNYEKDAAVEFTIARLRRATQQLSPPRFGAEHKFQNTPKLNRKPITVSNSIPRAVSTIPSSSIWLASKEITLDSTTQGCDKLPFDPQLSGT